MSEELKPCPFCGGEVSVVVVDEEGNIRDEEYERDPYSGLSYAVAHDDPNGACPIATYDGPLPWLYDSRDGVTHVWNRRAGRTCSIKAAPHDKGDAAYRCSACGAWFTDDASFLDDGSMEWFQFCPNCGARVVD